jgi:ABC-type uncharacterized transport system permease subunit
MIQLAWIGCFMIISSFVWAAGLKKYTASGA